MDKTLTLKTIFKMYLIVTNKGHLGALALHGFQHVL